MSEDSKKSSGKSARRRRRKGGGLRVPSDNVPRAPTDPGEQLVVSPQGEALAASPLPEPDLDEEMPTIVSEPARLETDPEGEDDEPTAIVDGSEDETLHTDLPDEADDTDSIEAEVETPSEEASEGDGAEEEETHPVEDAVGRSTIDTDEVSALEVEDVVEEAEESDTEAVPDDVITIGAATSVASSDDEEPADELETAEAQALNVPNAEDLESSGESVDIPFDDEGDAESEGETNESDEAQSADDGSKKPRFKRALTMALNESDLEEVRGEGDAAPTEISERAESGEVIGDEMLEEVMAEEPPVHSVPKKRADSVEPPPTPAAAGTLPPKAIPAPKAVPAPKALPPSKQAPRKPPPPAPAAEKKRKAKPWFEEVFDEDYLRTLPFLTPQATQFEANFVMESFGLEPGAQVLDVACGYGRHAMELAARGYHVVGLDSSLPLLLRGADEAQRRGLSINFVHGDMREMTFEAQFDGAYCLFSSFGYFDDETNKQTAQNIARALKPGARFVVEVLNRDYLVADLPSRVWWEGDGCVVLEEVEFNYFSSRIVSNRSVVFDNGRQLEQEISLRSFSLHELGKFLHAVGFRVLEISGSMSTRGRFFGPHSRDIVVVAERRAEEV